MNFTPMTIEQQKEVIAIIRRGWDDHMHSFEGMSEEDQEYLCHLARVFDGEKYEAEWWDEFSSQARWATHGQDQALAPEPNKNQS